MDLEMRNALEKENEQYLGTITSDAYQTGKRVREAQHLVKTGQLKKLIEKGRVFLQNSKVPTDPNAQDFFLNAPFSYAALSETDAPSANAKTVIYTCIMGNYDEPPTLMYKEPSVDYFLITDALADTDTFNGWNVMSAPRTFENPFLGNRYCKMHPHELFPNYDLAIYLDGNITPISDISRFGICATESKTGIAAHGHPERTCLFDEAEACIRKRRGNPTGIREWVDELQHEGMPTNFGLLEMSVVYYDLNSEMSKELAEKWWQTLTNSSSKRDQLILPYVTWKNALRMEDFGIIGPSLRTNYAFSFKPWHGDSRDTAT